jgi:hypothetical protein
MTNGLHFGIGVALEFYFIVGLVLGPVLVGREAAVNFLAEIFIHF